MLVRITRGTVGEMYRTSFLIMSERGLFRVFIGGIHRTSRKTYQGAVNAIKRIGPIQITSDEERLID